MTFVTAAVGPGRISQIIWGARLQNTLTFGYPSAVDNARFWRAPRVGSEQVVVAGQPESWTQARDFWGALSIRWVHLSRWSGHGGVQAFLDYATGGAPFTIVPDAVNAPLFVLPGCLLGQPFSDVSPQGEDDGSQQVEITFRNPTLDLGLAWR